MLGYILKIDFSFTPTLVSCAIATVTILPPLYHPHATCIKIVIARNPKIEHNNGSHLVFLLCVSYMYMYMCIYMYMYIYMCIYMFLNER